MRIFLTFFKFYYYLFKKSPKRFDLVNKFPDSFHILIVPVIFMIIHMIIGMITMNMNMVFLLSLYIILIPGNLIIVGKVRNEEWEIQRQLRKEKEEAERLQREYRNQKYEEAIKKKMAEEKARREYEKRKKEQERFFQKKSNLEYAYKTLGISTNSDFKIVKSVYRKLSKKYHPDMPNGNEQIFIEIKNAYDLISKMNKIG